MKGGAAAVRVQMALSRLQSVISLNQTRTMRWPSLSRLQKQWQSCDDDQILFGRFQCHTAMEGMHIQALQVQTTMSRYVGRDRRYQRLLQGTGRNMYSWGLILLRRRIARQPGCWGWQGPGTIIGRIDNSRNGGISRQAWTCCNSTLSGLWQLGLGCPGEWATPGRGSYGWGR